MRKHLKTTFAIAALAIGLLATATVMAHESESPKNSMMGQGMMGQGMMGQGMMGQNQMMGGGMMNMMGQMSQMMETCNEMMQSRMDGHGKSNDPSPELEDKG